MSYARMMRKQGPISRIGQNVTIDAGVFFSDCQARIDAVMREEDFFRYFTSVGQIHSWFTSEEEREYLDRWDQYRRDLNYCYLLGLPAGLICRNRVTAAFEQWGHAFFNAAKTRRLQACLDAAAAEEAAEDVRRRADAQAAEAERRRRISEGSRARMPGGFATNVTIPGSPVGPVSQAPTEVRPSPVGPLVLQPSVLQRPRFPSPIGQVGAAVGERLPPCTGVSRSADLARSRMQRYGLIGQSLAQISQRLDQARALQQQVAQPLTTPVPLPVDPYSGKEPLQRGEQYLLNVTVNMPLLLATGRLANSDFEQVIPSGEWCRRLVAGFGSIGFTNVRLVSTSANGQNCQLVSTWSPQPSQPADFRQQLPDWVTVTVRRRSFQPAAGPRVLNLRRRPLPPVLR